MELLSLKQAMTEFNTAIELDADRTKALELDPEVEAEYLKWEKNPGSAAGREG